MSNSVEAPTELEPAGQRPSVVGVYLTHLASSVGGVRAGRAARTAAEFGFAVPDGERVAIDVCHDLSVLEFVGLRIAIFSCQLRPSGATHSLMLAAGFSAFEVSRFMGHASAATTTDIYGHLIPVDRAEQISRFEAFVASS